MAQSEKYSFFNKSKNGGFLGKPYQTSISTALTVYDNCSLSNPFQVYISNNETLIIGTTVYNDAELTIPLTDGFFIKDNYTYYLVAGQITEIAICYNSWSGHTDCSQNTPVDVYTAFSVSSLQLGTVLYENTALTILYSGGFFVKDSILYTISSGTITNIGACLNSVTPVYTNCDQIQTLDVYINGSIPSYFSDGTRLYSNPEGTTELTAYSQLVYNGYIYDYFPSGTANATTCTT